MHRTVNVNAQLEFILPEGDDLKRITNAGMVELVDTPVLEAGALCMRVRVLLPAPYLSLLMFISKFKN